MTDDKKDAALLARRNALVSAKLNELTPKEVEEFERVLRTYYFVYEKLRWTKKILAATEEKLSKNQNSILMYLITREEYKSTQDYVTKITEEFKRDLYELELEKIGISYVPYQREFEQIRNDLLNPNLSEEENHKNHLISELYSVSLKIKVLQRMGCSFS
jgi:hypothetical protein